MTDTWPQVDQLRSAIAETERTLAGLKNQRRAVIDGMAAAGLTRREIGALWGVSNVAITAIIHGKRESNV